MGDGNDIMMMLLKSLGIDVDNLPERPRMDGPRPLPQQMVKFTPSRMPSRSMLGGLGGGVDMGQIDLSRRPSSVNRKSPDVSRLISLLRGM